jgi:hypothetical protein
VPQFGNNAPTSDKDRDDTLQGIRRICAEIRFFRGGIAAILLLSAVLTACEAAVEDAATRRTPAAVAAEMPAADCGPAGYVQTELFGALAGTIEWDHRHVICEGMPRPDSVGARLRFAGSAADDVELAFIIALPELRRGQAGKELQSKVTIIEEGVGRFFSNGDQDTCWTDVLELEPLPNSDSLFAIRGALYCVAPLAEVNGNADVSLDDFEFRGLLDWDAS